MNKQEEQPRQLKNLLINPRFQFKFISYFLAVFLITTISLYSTTYLFFHKLKEKALNVGIPDGHIFFKFLQNQKQDLDSLFIGLALFNFIILISVGFIVSHRIAGPLFKLKRQLDPSIGDEKEFKLRETDFFQELEPLVENLKSRIK